ncbi:hypothetical protein R8510_03627 [Ralstonia chuxiongensis]|nr:hypothetical protein R8510_03627 [Ralstonia chuxiongensis]
MQHVRLMLEYFHPWTNAAGFYLARAKGWFARAGLDVEIVVRDDARGDTLDHVMRGDVHLGVCPTRRVLGRFEIGEPVCGVAAVNQRSLEAIHSVTGRGITRPRDLCGRRVALNPTVRARALLADIVRADGGDPDAVKLVDAGVRELTFDELRDGVADASFGSYWAWEGVMPSTLPDAQRQVWPIDEIGAPAYHSYLLAADARWLACNAGAVSGLLMAASRGFAAAHADPASAPPLFERVIPYFPRTTIARSLRAVSTTWLTDGVWGRHDASLMSGYAAWLARHGIVRRPHAWSAAVTDAYLPPRAARAPEKPCVPTAAGALAYARP